MGRRIFDLIIMFMLLSGCSNSESESYLYGEWKMTDWNGEGYLSLDISLDFNKNGEFTDSRSGDAIWN